VHELDPALLEGLWGQFERAEVTREGLVAEADCRARTCVAPGDVDGGGAQVPALQVAMPKLPGFLTRDNTRADYGTHELRHGFALDLWLQLETLEAGQVLVDTRVLQSESAGLALVTTDRGTIEIILNDRRTENRWDCDPGTIEAEKLHHLVVSVDGGPKIITFVVDGRLSDGGEARQFGWGRFSPNCRTPEGSDTLRLAPQVKSLRLYDRYLRTSEAISNYRAGFD
jgi:hypothetical protein